MSQLIYVLMIHEFLIYIYNFHLYVRIPNLMWV